MPDTIVLENATLRAEFSRRNGALLLLEHKATGWRVQRRPECALSFRLLVPLPSRRNNPILGMSQAPPELRPSQDGKGLTFVWKRCLSEHGGHLDITFTSQVTLSDEGLKFDGTIENKSPYTVECAYYPSFGDLARPEGCQVFTHINSAYGRLEKHSLFPTFTNERGYFGTDRPVQMSSVPETPFAMVAAPDQGLYVG
ncbi:MAG: hypothetical protein HQ546_11370, partial [Planctomycetes bacterium]|nr:hypothetical protein [Planctomycetota bacterium]